MNNKAPNKHSDARSFEMRRLIFLGAAGVLILVVVILSLLSAFGGIFGLVSDTEHRAGQLPQ